MEKRNWHEEYLASMRREEALANENIHLEQQIARLVQRVRLLSMTPEQMIQIGSEDIIIYARHLRTLLVLMASELDARHREIPPDLAPFALQGQPQPQDIVEPGLPNVG